MKKTRLSSVRISKGITQQEMASKLFMDVSTYNRKELGSVKIRKEEWTKIASALEVDLEEIYESEENHLFIVRDQGVAQNFGTNNIYTIPESLLESQRKYIQLLEAEIERLKNQGNSVN